MPRFIALYRGINVGGRNIVPMKKLLALHESLGHRDVVNYIQSGNIVFTAAGSVRPIEKALGDAFVKAFGFAAKVMVIDAKRWCEIAQRNPFSKQATDEPKSVHVAICQGKPVAKALDALLSKTGAGEAFVIRDDVIYLHAPAGIGRSKFAASLEKSAAVPMTMRNWRTVETLVRLCELAAG